LGADVEHDPTRGVRISELRRELCDSLADISPEQAQVIVLKDALGYTFEEIATAAGMPVGTAKCHAHRGRSRLRERLERRDVA
jgi:RNA polymerase sigma-70 factor (ECF subfamily)